DAFSEHPLCWPAFQVKRKRVLRGLVPARTCNERTSYSVKDTAHIPSETFVIPAALHSAKGDRCFCEVIDCEWTCWLQASDGLLLQVHDYADVYLFEGLRPAAPLGSLSAFTRQRQCRVGRPRCRQATGDHRSQGDDARASSEHRESLAGA